MKKAARKKEKEIEEEERQKMEMMGKVMGNGDGVARNGSKLGVGRNTSVRKSEISRPFAGQTGDMGSAIDEKGDFERAADEFGYGYGEEKRSWGEEKEMGIGLRTDSPVPSYHSMDEEKGEWRKVDSRGARNGTSNADTDGNANELVDEARNEWHRV